ncbi:MAG: T9SS type A sorting domain-containing protein [Bacteroidales bacterium]|nr:T9SS type A sorting domain-containing protein [Bacteroidales bacterium]
MKLKSLLCAISLMASPILFGQALITEDFSANVMPPTGWTIDGQVGNWSVAASANSGGTAPEAKLNWTPQFNTTTRLVSPIVNTTGYTSLILSFKHFVDHYSSTFNIGVATRTGTGTWNQVWQQTANGNIGPEMKVMEINNADVGSADFQFCIYFSGNSYNMDEWNIDDIELSISHPRDGGMASLSVPTYSLGNLPVEGKIINMGLNTITSTDINWQIDNGVVNTTPISGLNVVLGQNYSFSCTQPLALTPGAYSLKVWLSNVNGLGPDDNALNDTISKALSIATNSVSRKPIFEEFTSSTCAPCASFNNSVFNAFTATNADDITLIKYQMSWPAPGDPYYTEEGGVRRAFYGVSYVPDLIVEGKRTATTAGGVNGAFTTAMESPAFMESSAYHVITGTTIEVTADIMPYITGNLIAYIVVYENITTQNVGNNGETEFHHVMMKMLPDAYGTTVNFVAGEYSHLNFSADLSSTHVEDMNDLGVAIFVQDPATREIFQSSYSVASTVGVKPIGSIDNLNIYPNPSKGIIKIDGIQSAGLIHIYSITGQLVKEIQNYNGGEIFLNDLENGTYILRFQTPEGLVSSRINILK